MASKKFKDLVSTSSIDLLLGAAEDSNGTTLGNKFAYSADATMTANSDAIVPTQKAVKSYTDTAASGAVTTAEGYADDNFIPNSGSTLGYIPVADSHGNVALIDGIKAGTNVTIDTNATTGAKTINASGGSGDSLWSDDNTNLSPVNARSVNLQTGQTYKVNGTNILTGYATTGYVDTAVSGKVTANPAISGATKIKITYDEKGLVTAGYNATTADIAASTDKNYVTDAEKLALTGANNPSASNVFATMDDLPIISDQGLRGKIQVAVASTENLVLGGEQTIDGILTHNSRILVKNQNDQTLNGIYVTNSSMWTRADDANTGELLSSAFINVLGGTTQAGFTYFNTNLSIEIGVTSILFALFSNVNSNYLPTANQKAALAGNNPTSGNKYATIADLATTIPYTWDGSISFSAFYSTYSISSLNTTTKVVLTGSGHVIDNRGSQYTNLDKLIFYSGITTKTVTIANGATANSLPHLCGNISFLFHTTNYFVADPTNTYWEISGYANVLTDNASYKGIQLTRAAGNNMDVHLYGSRLGNSFPNGYPIFHLENAESELDVMVFDADKSSLISNTFVTGAVDSILSIVSYANYTVPASDYFTGFLGHYFSSYHTSTAMINQSTDRKYVTDNQKDALDAANLPSSTNAFATMDDLSAIGDINIGNEVFVDAIYGNDTTGEVNNLSLKFATFDAAAEKIITTHPAGGYNYTCKFFPGTYADSLSLYPNISLTGDTAGNTIINPVGIIAPNIESFTAGSVNYIKNITIGANGVYTLYLDFATASGAPISIVIDNCKIERPIIFVGRGDDTLTITNGSVINGLTVNSGSAHIDDSSSTTGITVETIQNIVFNASNSTLPVVHFTAIAPHLITANFVVCSGSVLGVDGSGATLTADAFTMSGYVTLAQTNGATITVPKLSDLTTATTREAADDSTNLATTAFVHSVTSNLGSADIPVTGDAYFAAGSISDALNTLSSSLNWDGATLFSEFYIASNFANLDYSPVVVLKGTGHTIDVLLIDETPTTYTNMKFIGFDGGESIKTISIANGAVLDAMPRLTRTILQSDSASAVCVNPVNTMPWELIDNSAFKISASCLGIEISAASFAVTTYDSYFLNGLSSKLFDLTSGGTLELRMNGAMPTGVQFPSAYVYGTSGTALEIYTDSGIVAPTEASLSNFAGNYNKWFLDGSTRIANESGGVAGASISEALNNLQSGKEAAITSGTTSQYWRGDKSWQTLNAAAVGLGSVPNVDVDTKLTEQNTIMLSPHGFENQTDSTYSYNSSTRVLTVSPASSSFDIWIRGVKHTISTTKTAIAHANTPGMYYYYFDNNAALQVSDSFPNLYTGIPCFFVYYYSTTEYFVEEERHDCVMDVATHLELHNKIGTYYVSGLATSGYSLSPTSPIDANNQFVSASGVISDEGLTTNISEVTSGNYNVMYLDSNGKWTWQASQTFPFLHETSGYIYYNQNTSGNTWALTPLTGIEWVNYYVIYVPSLTANRQMFIVMGQKTYSSLTNAKAESFANLNISGLPIPEYLVLYQINYRTSNGYTSTGKVRIEGFNRIIQNIASIANNVATNHESLSGLLLAGTGVTWGHINDQAQTIDGAKTFSSAPVLNSLTASELVKTDASKNLSSITNAAGFLYNDGDGNFSYETVGSSVTVAQHTATVSLTASDPTTFISLGNATSTPYQINLPDATTLAEGYKFTFYNYGSAGQYNATIAKNDGSTTIAVGQFTGAMVECVLVDNATTNGSWMYKTNTWSIA